MCPRFTAIVGFGVLDNFLDAHSGLNQLGPGASPLDIQGTFHGLTWDRIQDPLLAMGSLIDPGALLSSSLDKASPLRLSVVSLEDDQLRALADELLFGRLIDGGRLTVDLDDKDESKTEVLLDIQPLPKREGRAKPEETTAG